ncbi:MAG: hypothetical protein ACJ73D_07675 [Pyrinomonadaceae bacterium]
MIDLMDYPGIVLTISLAALSVAVWIGSMIAKRWRPANHEFRDDFSLVLSATLTLLALIIGFTFSMAVSRYDQRKHVEEEETNAIETEYFRLGLLPAPDAAKARMLLRDYYEERISFYSTRDSEQVRKMDESTLQLQGALWATVNTVASVDHSPTIALTASGMNDVLNSQGFAQAAAWNRIPSAAWLLMAFIAVFCHLQLGYWARSVRAERLLMMVLPLMCALSFALIADVDSPRGGFIRIHPDNLESITQTFDPKH